MFFRKNKLILFFCHILDTYYLKKKTASQRGFLLLYSSLKTFSTMNYKKNISRTSIMCLFYVKMYVVIELDFNYTNT